MVEAPAVVQQLTDAVSHRLGRPACLRKVKNRDEWFISDPVFSFVQHGMKKGVTGYRVGYRFDFREEPHELQFCLVHSPLMSRLFKHNLAFSSLVEVVQRTAAFRDLHWLYRSSRIAQRDGFDGDRIESATATEFVALLHQFDAAHGFLKDMFPRTWNRGKKGTLGKQAKWAGNTFYLALSDRLAGLDSPGAVASLVELSWPLFLCLYPLKPIQQRMAQLARSLRAKRIPRACEFAAITMSPCALIDPLCRGEVQGAHIVPDSRGGSDKAENGLWLCEYHHQATEGHLAGCRNGVGLEVQYTP